MKIDIFFFSCPNTLPFVFVSILKKSVAKKISKFYITDMQSYIFLFVYICLDVSYEFKVLREKFEKNRQISTFCAPQLWISIGRGGGGFAGGKKTLMENLKNF